MEYGIVNIYRVVQQVPHGAAGLVMTSPGIRGPLEMQDLLREIGAADIPCPIEQVGVYYKSGFSGVVDTRYEWIEFNEAESGGEK